MNGGRNRFYKEKGKVIKMTNREIINNNIKRVLSNKGLSIRWLADEMEMNPSSLYTYLNRNDTKKIDLDIIDGIAAALKISTESLFDGTSIEKSETVNAERLINYIDAEMAYANALKNREMNPRQVWYYNGIQQGLSLALMYIEGEQEKEAEEE